MFEQIYRCYPMSYINKEEFEKGDKIIMPPSALDRLGYLEIDYPMLFQLRNPSSGKVTHCGVLEFTADEGLTYLPSWMMESMLVEHGGVLIVRNASLSKGTYVKLQPHTKDFLDVSNPRAILETTLRNYSCLTSGGTIVIFYNGKKFYSDILETKPSHAICIIETDCEVDFAPPLDYVEPEKPAKSTNNIRGAVMEFSAFTGSARRLDGKASTQQVEPVSFPENDGSNDSTTKSSDLQQSGRLVFGSNATDAASNGKRKPSNESSQDPTLKEENKFKAFTGRKYLLRG